MTVVKQYFSGLKSGLVPADIPTMRRLSWLKIAIILLSFAAGPIAHGDGLVQSDFVFQMNSSVFKGGKFDFIPYLTGNEVFTLADSVVQDELPVYVKGISADVKYELLAGTPSVTLGSELAFMSKSVAMKFLIKEISVNGYVEIRENGRVIRALVQGACQNIQIDLVPGKTRVVGSVMTGIDAQGMPTVGLPYFEAQFATGAWTINDFPCSVGNGFKDRVVAGLKSYLSNTGALNASMKQALQDRLSTFEKAIRAEFLSPMVIPIDLKGLKATLYPRRIVNIKNDGFQVIGQVDVSFPSASPGGTLTVSSPSLPGAAGGFSLIFPENFVHAMNEMAFRTGLYVYRKAGQEIDAFRELLAGGFKQYFVWPELSQYAADSAFIFDFWTEERPSLDNLTDAGDGGLVGQLMGGLHVQVWAPYLSGYRKMIRFDTPVASRVKLSFSPTATGANLNVQLSNMHLDLSSRWDPQYTPSNDYIGISSIQDALIEAGQTQGLQMPLQKLPLNTLRLTPSALRKRGAWLSIDWQ